MPDALDGQATGTSSGRDMALGKTAQSARFRSHMARLTALPRLIRTAIPI
jgi:hypothetical protein